MKPNFQPGELVSNRNYKDRNAYIHSIMDEKEYELNFGHYSQFKTTYVLYYLQESCYGVAYEYELERIEI